MDRKAADEMSTPDLSGLFQGSSNDVPIHHLDYRFIEECTDVRHLAKVLRVLRSGVEGHYPDLTAFCERRIEALSPRNRALRKDKPPATPADFSWEEWQQINNDFKNFLTDIKVKEEHERKIDQKKDNLPPIRNVCSNPAPQKPNDKEKSTGKGSLPRSYRDWDRFDVDKELSKMDENCEKGEQSKTIINSPATNIKESLDTSGLNPQQKRLVAEREKEKGNEAFRSGDYEEAISYYSRSISVQASAAAYNNRAQAMIKLKNWQSALTDCDQVLDLEPNNVKALLRRASVNKSLQNYGAAADDLKTVLLHEAENPIAKKLLCEVNVHLQKERDEKPKKGRRMIIQDVEGSDEESPEKSDLKPGAGVTVGGETAAEPTDMGNAQKKFSPKRGNEKDEAGQTPTHGKGSPHQNGLRKDGGHGQATHPSGHKARAPESEVTSRTGNQEAELSLANLPPSARLKAEGNQLFKNGQFGEAAVKYTEAIENVKNAGAEDTEELAVLYSNRAACHLKDGNCSLCIEDCNKSLELQPFSIKPLLRRAMANESLERYKQAYVDYKVALQIDSSLQLANDSVNRITKTLIDLDGPSWREKLPPIPSVPVDTQIQMQERSAATAKASNKPRPVSDDGESAQRRFQTLKQEGNDHVKKSQYREAVKKYTECLQINPEECTIYTNRALCHLKLSQYEEARHDCDCALQRDAYNIKALYRRAQAYKGLENFQDCANDLQKVISLDSSVAEAKNLLAEITPFLANGVKASPQDKQRKKILIEEVNEENTPSDSSKPKAPPRSKHQRVNRPSNAYEFEQAMSEIRAWKDQETCAQLLTHIAPEDLPTFLSNKLDAETFLLLTRSLKQHLLEEKPALVYQHLHHLSTAERFSVVFLLLSQTEKEEVQSLLRDLSGKRCESLDAAAMSSLETQYGL